MEAKTTEWRPGPTVCRCCLTEGCYKDISTEYFWMGKREVYAEMLLETFDLNISYSQSGGPNSNSRLICEPCISRLRDAADFKRQVVECERSFTQFLDPVAMADVDVNLELGKEVKLEHVKDEKTLSEEEDDEFVPPDFGDGDDDDDDDLDDQPLTKLASKIPKKESVDVLDLLDNAKMTEKRKSSSKSKSSPAKKTKLKKDMASSSKVKPEPRKKKDSGSAKSKDWTKIAERRGRGPLLRENSLRLIQNSTMFVFQWHRSRFTCFFCKAPFIDIISLREHTKTEHAEMEEHNMEKKIIAQQNKLLKVEISILKCKQCSEEFKTLPDFRQHLEGEHEMRFEDGGDLLVPFKLESEGLKCQTCRESFALFRLLSIHVNKHYQNHVCHVCGAGFTSLVLLNLHKTRLHRMIKCKACDVIFLNRREKRAHDVNYHDLRCERKLRFLCPYCDERFFQENVKIQHLVDKHGVEKPEHKCELCAKVFITKSLCNNHVKNVHKKEKNHECEVCHKLFYTKSDVRRHRVTHTGEKKFTCILCNNLFATKDSLRRHTKRTHVLN